MAAIWGTPPTESHLRQAPELAFLPQPMKLESGLQLQTSSNAEMRLSFNCNNQQQNTTSDKTASVWPMRSLHLAIGRKIALWKAF